MCARKQFTPEFKREAVQLLESGSRPASEIVRELGIARNWRCGASASSGSKPASQNLPPCPIG
jgi:transposase